MQSRLEKLEILSHGSWLLKKSRKTLGTSATKLVFGSIALSFMAGLISCSSASNPSNSSQTSPSPTVATSPGPTVATSPFFRSSDSPTPNNPGKGDQPPVKPTESTITKSPKPRIQADKATIAINIYQVDNQCNDFIVERVNLPQNNSLEMAVAKVIEKSSINEFNLASSKVTTDPQTGMATVDFQVAANSKRRFVSLSSCEQLNLFGSLRKTLIDNPDWQIKDVRFTEAGKELAL